MNRETLNELHRLTEEVRTATDVASEQMRIVKDRFADKTHKLVREGKEIELTEKVLWDEVFYLGVNCEAGKLLQKEHPEVFEAYKKQDETANTLKKFCVTELGVDYTKLTLSDYLKITEGLFSLLIEESKGEKLSTGN
jgi:hypothetical protein